MNPDCNPGAIAELDAEYLRALEIGRLIYQHCDHCDHSWLPPREQCPQCLGDHWNWRDAAGSGRLISWTIYHIAYHSDFADRLPYNVALVELDEGPRLVTNIDNPDECGGLGIEKPVTVKIVTIDTRPLARFVLV